LELKDIIKSCTKNDRQAQKQLFLKYKDILFALCLKYCRNEAEAEDNLHDSFITIFQNIKKYNSKGSFEGWMKRITINKAIDKYKKKKQIPIEIINDLQEDTQMKVNKRNVDLNQILSCIQNLPNQYRLVFNMYQLDGYSHREIAQSLSISESTSKSNYHRAKIILKQKITDIQLPDTPHKKQSNGA